MELLSASAIAANLPHSARIWLAGLEIHEELDSTNSRLMFHAAAGAPSGSVCLAERQTAGRGRSGRTWQSPSGGNICLSLLWRYEEHAVVAGLSLAVGVAIIRSLRRIGVDGAGLKWPNDILWRERKLGGILLEIAGGNRGRCAVVVGIGLNMRIPAGVSGAIDQAWVDLNQIAGGALPSRNRLVALLIEEVLCLLANYAERGLSEYIDEWRRSHCHDGRLATLHVGDAAVRGRLVGISDKGWLVMDCEDGARREFASGDVRLRINV